MLPELANVLVRTSSVSLKESRMCPIVQKPITRLTVGDCIDAQIGTEVVPEIYAENAPVTVLAVRDVEPTGSLYLIRISPSCLGSAISSRQDITEYRGLVLCTSVREYGAKRTCKTFEAAVASLGFDPIANDAPPKATQRAKKRVVSS